MLRSGYRYSKSYFSFYFESPPYSYKAKVKFLGLSKFVGDTNRYTISEVQLGYV